MRRVNLIGQKFGKLTVIQAEQDEKTGKPVWKCQCDCGNIKYVETSQLKNGNTRSCGCLWRKAAKDIFPGQKFGKLTVIQAERNEKTGKTVWKCQCDCGNIKYVDTGKLKTGNTRSCGCLWRKAAKDIFPGQKFGKLTVIQAELDEKAHKTVWKCQCDCGNITYVDTGKLKTGNTRSCGCLHRKAIVGNGRKAGMTVKEKCENEGGTNLKTILSENVYKNNTSGYKGVSPSNGKWLAQISFRKKTYSLGLYTQIDDAVYVRKQAEKKIENFMEWYIKEFPIEKKRLYEKQKKDAVN